MGFSNELGHCIKILDDQYMLETLCFLHLMLFYGTAIHLNLKVPHVIPNIQCCIELSKFTVHFQDST